MQDTNVLVPLFYKVYNVLNDYAQRQPAIKLKNLKLLLRNSKVDETKNT